jgi:hypothetical protein
MHFMSEPIKGITQNAPMTEEQADIAAEFIDELWSLGVFELIPEGQEMQANAPLFTVPKPGQPGQWRVIADMKNGGQNDHILKDPVHLPRAEGILERLYMGGWSAIVDANGWTHLPDPRGQSGIRSRQSMCVGCHEGIRRLDPQHLCRFAITGFTLDGIRFVPCGSTYHMGCIRVGEPFCSRLPAGRGLVYPRTRIAPPFICKTCTVRAQLGSELRKSEQHLGLLMLKQMQIVDQANAWS